MGISEDCSLEGTDMIPQSEAISGLEICQNAKKFLVKYFHWKES